MAFSNDNLHLPNCSRTHPALRYEVPCSKSCMLQMLLFACVSARIADKHIAEARVTEAILACH